MKIKSLLLKTLTIAFLGTFYASAALAAVDMQIIAQIESSGNPRAYNSRSEARGLYQITPIVLVEYNDYNKTSYVVEDLFSGALNAEIAHWYMNKRIPQMLKYFGRPVTARNQIIAYNAGIYYVKNDHLPLPKETQNYLVKYERLSREKN